MGIRPEDDLHSVDSFVKDLMAETSIHISYKDVGKFIVRPGYNLKDDQTGLVKSKLKHKGSRLAPTGTGIVTPRKGMGGF